MEPWKTLAREKILDRGKYLVVENHTVGLPDGRTIHDWSWIVTPDYVSIAAITRAGKFLCFRQVKYAVEGTSLAPAGGFIDPGETPLQAAKRELLEEMGHAADDWLELGCYAGDGNRGGGRAHLFLARGAYPSDAPDDPDLEEHVLVELSRSELEHALKAGDFKVLGWVTVMTLALLHLGNEPSDPT